MKEATGELNMTVVTIVAIAALLAFFYLLIWPNLKIGMALSSACTSANGAAYETSGGSGKDAWTITCKEALTGTQTCTYKDSNSKTSSRSCNTKKS